MTRSVSSTDREIIRLLQEDARISFAEISRATRIPESTVRRRMDRMQQLGIIEFTMLADPAKLGYEIRAMVGLRVELTRLSAIADQLRSFDEVTFAAFVTGNFDVMVQVVVQSQEKLVEFLTRRIAPIEGVRSSETFVMPWIIKPMTSWILPEYSESVATANDDVHIDDDLEDDLPSPEKRGRGRPRKPVAVG